MGGEPGGLAHELVDGMAGRERGAVGVLGSIPWDGTLRQVQREQGIRVILGEVGGALAAALSIG